MTEPHSLAIDVVRVICDRLTRKAGELRLLIETGCSFEDWLAWEAYLSCKARELSYPYCEVATRPTYGSEGVAGDDGQPSEEVGELRVGGSEDPERHLWVFAEIALLYDGNRAGDGWRQKVAGDMARLKRLGWKKSIAMLVVVAASRATAFDEIKELDVWNQPALTDPCSIVLPDGGSVLVAALDVKQDPADIVA